MLCQVHSFVSFLLPYTTKNRELHHFHPGNVTLYRGSSRTHDGKGPRSYTKSRKIASGFGKKIHKVQINEEIPALDLDKVLGEGKSEKEVIKSLSSQSSPALIPPGLTKPKKKKRKRRRLRLINRYRINRSFGSQSTAKGALTYPRSLKYSQTADLAPLRTFLQGVSYRHGDHVGQRGTPGRGGSQPGFRRAQVSPMSMLQSQVLKVPQTHPEYTPAGLQRGNSVMQTMIKNKHIDVAPVYKEDPTTSKLASDELAMVRNTFASLPANLVVYIQDRGIGSKNPRIVFGDKNYGLLETYSEMVSGLHVSSTKDSGGSRILLRRYRASDLTLMHELAHALDHDFEVSETISWDDVWRKEKRNLTDYATTNKSEGYAEAFTLYVTKPEQLKSSAPDTYEFMKRTVKILDRPRPKRKDLEDAQFPAFG